jgi:hypothetical protein
MLRVRLSALTIAPPVADATDQNADFPKYCVDTRKQLDIGNYACALLAPFRLVFGKIIRSAPSYVKNY